MPPSVDLSDEIFARLQKHAIPLVDTPLSVISRALDALEAGDEEPISTVAPSSGPRSFNPAAPPNLSHTAPRRAQVAGQTLSKSETYWNSIMCAAIAAAARQGVSTQDLLELLTIPAVEGEKEGNGYRYIREANISVQGQDANRAWKQTYKIASSVGVSLQVTFIWQDTPKAAMPNTTGSFFVEG